VGIGTVFFEDFTIGVFDEEDGVDAGVDAGIGEGAVDFGHVDHADFAAAKSEGESKAIFLVPGS